MYLNVERMLRQTVFFAIELRARYDDESNMKQGRQLNSQFPIREDRLHKLELHVAEFCLATERGAASEDSS